MEYVLSSENVIKDDGMASNMSTASWSIVRLKD